MHIQNKVAPLFVPPPKSVHRNNNLGKEAQSQFI